MKQIAIYSRKSKETDKGESIKNQIEMCKEYFKRQYEDCNFEVFQDEGFSGKNIDRPSFQRMMILAKRKKFDIIACYKVDRISRNIVDFMNTYDALEKHDIALVSISEGFDPSTPGGKMMLIMLAGFAEMERMNIAERVKDNMQALAKVGRWSGGTPPTGYKSVEIDTGNKIAMYLELIPEWIEKIKLIFKSVAEGHTSMHTATVLNIPSKTVANIINNPVYCKSDELSKKYLESLGYQVYGVLDGNGYLAYNRRPRAKNGKKLYNAQGMFVAVSKHEALIDSSVWITANEQLKQRGDEARPRVSQFSFLSHLVNCSCGSGMFITPGHRRKNGSRTYYFSCSAQKHDKASCKTGWVNAGYLEEDILEMLEKASKDISFLEKYINKKPNKDVKKEITNLKKIIAVNNSKLVSLTEKLILVEGSAATMVADKMNSMSKENDILNENLLELERANLLDDIVDTMNIDILQQNIIKLLKGWNGLDISDKQFEIRTIIKKIVWDGEKDFQVLFNI